MLVTMFTDASFNEALRRGTWAMWAKMNGSTIRYSGIIKEPLPFVGEAELSAIANGLYCVKRSFSVVSNDKIICQTDCKEAIDAIHTRNHPRPQARHLVNYILAFARENSYRLEFRHVKGHKGNETPRNAVNTWCDRECRRRMGELISQEKDKEKQQRIA